MGHIQLTICYICLEIAGGCKFPLIKNPSLPASLQMSALHHTQGSFGLTNTPHHTHTHNLRVSYFIMVIIQMYESKLLLNCRYSQKLEYYDIFRTQYYST